MKLSDLKPGDSAQIVAVGGEGALRQHFLDMGMIPGAEVTVMKLAPMGDPMELRIHGYELAVRLADAEKIEIKTVIRRQKCKTRSAAESGPITLAWVRRESSIRRGVGIRCRRERS